MSVIKERDHLKQQLLAAKQNHSRPSRLHSTPAVTPEKVVVEKENVSTVSVGTQFDPLLESVQSYRSQYLKESDEEDSNPWNVRY